MHQIGKGESNSAKEIPIKGEVSTKGISTKGEVYLIRISAKDEVGPIKGIPCKGDISYQRNFGTDFHSKGNYYKKGLGRVHLL